MASNILKCITCDKCKKISTYYTCSEKVVNRINENDSACYKHSKK